MKTIQILSCLVLLMLSHKPACADDPGYQLLWTSLGRFPGGGLPSSYIGDIDGDMRNEIVSLSDPIVSVRDAMTGIVEFSTDVGSGPSIHLVDLDADGTPELIASRDHAFWVFDYMQTVQVVPREEADSGAPPARNSLGRPSPNPFNPSTSIAFEVARGGRVEIELFDVAGRRVRQLAEGWMDAGPHSVDWDGKDATGVRLASGTYFYRMVLDGRLVGSNRAVLLK